MTPNPAFAVLASLVMVAAASAGAPAHQPSSAIDAHTALVIIDVQNFYFPGGQLPLVGPEAAAAKARTLLDFFRAHHLPVIHVQHLPSDQAKPTPDSGNEQYRIRPEVMPRAGEEVIGKHYANAFRDTPLLGYLHQHAITNLVICGMQTHMCVEATTRAAADYGFHVTVVSDACATRSLSFGGVTVPAAEVHATALATMNGVYAKVVSTADFLASTR